MQVELLRDLFNQAIKEPDEKIRIGSFWCFASDYEEYLPYLKEIFINTKIKSVTTSECKITRINVGFLISDFYGGVDIYSYTDTEFFIDLWDKVQKVEPNVIFYNLNEPIS